MSVNLNSFVRKILKIILPLVLGVFILYFLYKGTDFNKMWETIKNANFAIIAFSLIFGLLGNIIRGLRWKLLIDPLGYDPSNKGLIYAVLGSYAVNFVIPRGGEVWRCAVVSRNEKIPFPKLIGSMLLDRVSDTATVACIILLACCFNVNFFVSYINKNQALSSTIDHLLASPYVIGGVILAIILTIIAFTALKQNVVIKKIRDFFVGIFQDMMAIFKMKKKTRFLVYTVSIWVSYFLYFYMTFFAFDFTRYLGITAGLIAFAISSLSMAIPTNGGVGVWHTAVVLSLSLYGVNRGSAEAFAFAVFAIQSIWVVVYGLFGVFALSLQQKK